MTETQLVGNFMHRHALRQQTEHIEFPRRKTGDRRLVVRARGIVVMLAFD